MDDPATASRSGGAGDGNERGPGRASEPGGSPTRVRTAPHEDAETGRVQTNGVETSYERRGEGPPIVFVHGLFMNTAQWRAQLAALADAFTTVAYDVRGHGHTGGSARSAYDVDLFAADLDALVAALDLEAPVVCGLSMGGAIAQVYAATRPGPVAGLILADTFPATRLSPGGRLLFANLRLLGRLDRLVRYTTLNRLQLRVGNRLSPGVAGDPAAVQRALEAGPTIAHAEVRKIADAVAAFPGRSLDATRITAPTLLAYGADTAGPFRAIHERLAAQLVAADVEVAVVPDAGHASNLDNPAAFTAAVRSFAGRVHGLED